MPSYTREANRQEPVLSDLTWIRKVKKIKCSHLKQSKAKMVKANVALVSTQISLLCLSIKRTQQHLIMQIRSLNWLHHLGKLVSKSFNSSSQTNFKKLQPAIHNYNWCYLATISVRHALSLWLKILFSLKQTQSRLIFYLTARIQKCIWCSNNIILHQDLICKFKANRKEIKKSLFKCLNFRKPKRNLKKNGAIRSVRTNKLYKTTILSNPRSLNKNRAQTRKKLVNSN